MIAKHLLFLAHMATVGLRTIPERNLLFTKWAGTPIKDDFGHKGVIDVDGRPMFAELAITEMLKREGYTTRWIETYQRRGRLPMFMVRWDECSYKEQTNVPIAESWVTNILVGIAKLNHGSYAGCWDVLAWKDDELLFVESKRKKRDAIRGSQIVWLEAALRYGLTEQNFLLAEWDYS